MDITSHYKLLCIADSCQQAGYTDCCGNGACQAGSAQCFCDSDCYLYDDCCKDIENICTQQNNESIEYKH